MNKEYQKKLLKALYEYYPSFSEEWMNLSWEGLAWKSPDLSEVKRNIAFLKEKHFIEENPPHSGNLRITAEGIEYLDLLEQNDAKK